MYGRYVRRSDKQKLAEWFHARPEPAELLLCRKEGGESGAGSAAARTRFGPDDGTVPRNGAEPDKRCQ